MPHLPAHHPDEGLLMDYAAGSLPEPVALVVATHLALCPACRESVALCETLGGALLDDAPDVPPSDDGRFDALLARLDEPERAAPAAADPAPDILIPKPLRDYLDVQSKALRGRSFRSVKSTNLLTGHQGYRTQFLRIRPGAAMPEHTHGGLEMTLVLAGGFSDKSGHYERGDLCIAGDETVHSPVADPGEACLCLSVTDAPLRLTGRFTRLLNPLLRF